MYKKIALCLFCLFCTGFSAERFEGDLHVPRLKILQKKGFCPKVIYDVGAYKGNWSRELKNVFPEARFFLFEANGAHEADLQKTGFPYFISLLGDENKNVVFHSNNTTGDSVFLENTTAYADHLCREKILPMMTLKTVVEKHRIPLPDYVKIDVQGAEKLILEGGWDVISHADVIVLETKILEYNLGAPPALELLEFMDRRGYVVNDILECHYLSTGELCEVDFLFVKKGSNLILK